MREGNILQYDAPLNVYDAPADRFVGSFIGNPPMNFVAAEIERNSGELAARVGDWRLRVPADMRAALNAYADKKVTIGIRAEAMEVLEAEAPDALGVNVEVVEPLGSQNLLTVRVGGSVMKVSTRPDLPVKSGDTIWLRFPEAKIRWLDADTGHAISPVAQAAGAA
jgi:multiple sugar transport system ATP-binding protein